MRDRQNIIGEGSLQFYGKITASISHELKNVLAIINENAGLLEDFTIMADRGKPLDPDRLKLMSAAVKKQVKRADGILKNMNSFAHSTDKIFTEIDLNQIIDLFVALTERLVAMRGISLDLNLTSSPIMVTTAPFCLINLLWLCLDFCMSTCADDKRVEIVVKETENSVGIRIRKLADLTEELLKAFPTDREKNLIDVLRAELTLGPGYDEVVLQLPIADTLE